MVRLLYFIIISLAFITNCQPHLSGRSSDLADSFSSPSSPTLLALQLRTVDLKREKGIWAESAAEYLQVTGDSAGRVLEAFDVLEFKKVDEQLIITYSLKDPGIEKNHNIEFIEYQEDGGSIQPGYSFASEVQQSEGNQLVKINEGMLTFTQVNEDAFSILHEFSGGVANNVITYRQP